VKSIDIIKNKTHFLVLFLLLFFISGCWKEIGVKQSENIPDFSYLEEWGDTLTIRASFDEYGEWGGHTEKLLIYYFDQELYGEYLRDTVKNKKELLDTIPQKIIEHRLFKIGENDKIIISRFLDSILSYSLRTQNFGHAGRHYTVGSEHLYIHFYDFYGATWKPYQNLKKLVNKSISVKLPSYIDRKLHLKLFNLKKHQKVIVRYKFPKKTSAYMWIDNADIIYGKNKTDIVIEIDKESLLDKVNYSGKSLIIKGDSSFVSQEKINEDENAYIKLQVKGDLYLTSKEDNNITLINTIFFEIDRNKHPYKLGVNSTNNNGNIHLIPPEGDFIENKVIIFIKNNEIKEVKIY
jgi:hypothetical protein